jgi:hypothetical protein
LTLRKKIPAADAAGIFLNTSSCPACAGHPRLVFYRFAKDVDGRGIYAKTRFALKPGHDAM